MRQKSTIVIVLTITTLAVLLRVWGIKFGLPFFFHPDEHYIIEPAFNFSFTNLDPKWFQWPGTFLMYLNFIAYVFVRYLFRLMNLLLGTEYTLSLTTAYLVGRTISMIFGLATVLIVYLLGSLVRDRKTGAVASLLYAVAFYPVLDAHYASPDTAAVFFIALSLYISLIILQRHDYSNRLLIILGLTAGLGMAIKYTTVLAIVPFILISFVDLVKSGKLRMAITVSAVVVFCTVIGFIIGCPFSLLDFATFKKDIMFELAHGSGQLRHLGFESQNPIISYLSNNIPTTLGWPMFILTIAGFAWSLYKRTRADILLLLFTILYFVFLQRQTVVIDRYLMPVLPIAVLLSARLIGDMLKNTMPQAIRVAGGLILAVIIALNVFDSVRLDSTISSQDSREIAGAWIEHHIPDGVQIAFDGYQPNVDSRFVLYSIWRRNETWLDYKPGTIRNGAKVLADLKLARVKYVVVASSYYERFFDPYSGKHQNDLIRSGRRFYELLDKNAKLIKEWDPNPKSKGFPMVRSRYDEMVYFEVPANISTLQRPGPTIRLYRLK